MRGCATLALVVLSTSACSTAVRYPVPEPLPEAQDFGAREAGGAFLGLVTRENDSGSLEELYFRPGVRVARVVENSPAEAAGVRPGDVVLDFGGAGVDDPGALDALVSRRSAGERVVLEIQREDTVFEVEVALSGRGAGLGEAAEVLYRLDPARTGAGWATAVAGVELVSLARESPIAAARIPLGSVVTALDGEPVRSDRELIRRVVELEPGTDVEFDFTTPEGDVRRASVELRGPITYVSGFSIPVLVHFARDIEVPSAHFELLDLWILSLFAYHRDGEERTWAFLRFFRFSTGVGELAD